MKITHNIALAVDESAEQEFAAFGIDLDIGFSCFKIDESNSHWPEVKELAKSFGAVDTTTTSFSSKELEDAEHVRLVGNWHHGYPEPSEEFGYLSEVYTLDKYCAECGSGLVQKNPFKFSNEPKWGNNAILQLNWVFDEFFVQPDAWKRIFEPFGIECREVLHIKSCNPLESVVQLVIPEEDVSLLLSDHHPNHTCIKCSTTKFLPICRGFFPPLSTNTKTPIFKTNECFGSGSDSHKAVILSKDLYSSLKQDRAKGVVFYPLSKTN